MGLAVIMAMLAVPCQTFSNTGGTIVRRATVLRRETPIDVDESPRLKFRTTVDAPVAPEVKKTKAQMNTINQQLLAEIEAARGSIRLEAPQVEEKEDIDFSDVNPLVALSSSVVTMVVAYYMFTFTTFMAASFADHPFTSSYYPIERFAGFLRQAIVGLSSLLTGLTALTGAGVGVLGITVAFGGGSSSSGEPGAAEPRPDEAD
ncbi:hypothetical protein CTAYLR_006781 [Chrysophaeum taylorii]|uniref:Uncharacterized protein n=1 Tax=Chrysophaeum taylorii TaxID=2483200 RepID=A0AAD7U958_9STRA|nr:hypothetical protein CTAYLR_006781 [Chrysophaeum taylorii]